MFGLDSLAPKFLVPSKRIQVLYEPAEFYTYLRTKIRTAKERVFLASLYLGKSEKELINVLCESLQQNEKLKVYVLVDALRGTREAPQQCSASLLSPLASKFPDRVQLAMYQTPKMSRILSALLPKRIIEGVGLQHMKMYGWDDEIVLSGANLSQDYFTNRQDRYIAIGDAKVTNWFFNVFSNVSSLSHRLLPAENEQGFELIKPNKIVADKARFNLKVLLAPPLTKNVREIEGRDEKHESDNQSEITEVYPLCQFTPLRLGNELEALTRITDGAGDPRQKFRWLFTAGYFNVQSQLARNLAKSQNTGEIIVASPQANGFYKSKGVSGKIPMFYSIFAKNFLASLPPHSPVHLREWQRGIVNTPGGWSYHAKGFWLAPIKSPVVPAVRSDTRELKENDTGIVNKKGNAELPILTYIGSSNFTKRSYRHDIECGAVLVARGSHNPVRKQLQDEADHLLGYCSSPLILCNVEKATPEPSLGDKVFLRIFGSRM